MWRVSVCAVLVVMMGCGDASDSGATQFQFGDENNAQMASVNNDSGDDGTNDQAKKQDPTGDDPVIQNPNDDTPNDPTDPMDPVEPGPSNGCGSSEGSGTWELEHDGMDRAMEVHVPRGYDANQPTPIVFNFHGRAMNAWQQEMFSGMTPVADDNGFIVVYPEGTGASQTWNAGVCCGSAQANNIDDVGFTAAMIDELESKLCIDTERVFVVGMSNGGYMSHKIGCELADRITAIGAVAGTMPFGDCSPAEPMPVLHFHGTADSIVPYNGFAGVDGAPASMDKWADLNNCGGTEVYFDQGDVTCERWTGCDAEVRFCTIDGGGHTWPGGTDFTFGTLGYTTNDISASEHFWEFFSQF